MSSDKFTKANKRNGDILLGYRKQNKITQLELGKLIGRDSREISKYETGVRAIPQAFVEIFNKKLHLKLQNTGKALKKDTIAALSADVKSSSKKSVSKSIKPEKLSLPNSKEIKPARKIVNTAKRVSSKTKTVLKGTNFSKRLIAFRESLNLNQKDFAKKYKFSISSLSRLENGKSSTISIESLRALSKSVSIEALIR